MNKKIIETFNDIKTNLSQPTSIKEESSENIYASRSAREIYNLVRVNPKYDHNKAIEALSEKDEFGEWIYFSGIYWKNFNCEKGLDALIKVDKTGEYVFLSGNFWKEFNYKKGLDFLKKVSKNDYYKRALKVWPLSASEALNRTNIMLDKIDKTKDRKIVLESKKSFEEILRGMPANRIYYAGSKANKKFDFETALDVLIEKDKVGEWLYLAGMHWKEFDQKKGLKAVNKVSPRRYFKLALNNWPKTAREYLNKTKSELKGVNKAKDKKMVLENADAYKEAREIYNRRAPSLDVKKWVEDLAEKDKTGEWIYLAGRDRWGFDVDRGLEILSKIKDSGRWIYHSGRDWKNFDNEKGLDALIKVGDDGAWIFNAGFSWKNFDNEKGLDTLIKVDKVGRWVYKAGEYWSRKGSFDYEKALRALIKTNKNGKFIYLASTNWNEFNYGLAIKALKNSPRSKKYYRKALMNWPKSASEMLDTVSDNLQGKEKAKDKKIVLENREWEDNFLKTATVEDIYERGKRVAWPTSEKFLDALIEKDTTNGDWIVKAGELWNNFNYKKGLDALIEKDRIGEMIVAAGTYWPREHFDYEKAFKDLLQKDISGKNIFEAGRSWGKKNIDRKKVFEILLKKDKTGEWIFRSGVSWRPSEFDFKAGLNFLKNKSSKYYKEALSRWPQTASQTLSKINKETSKINKSKDKKIVLESREDTEQFLKTASPEQIYKFGSRATTELPRDFFNALIKKDTTGEWIRKAGEFWQASSFDYKAGLDALLKLDKKGELILLAGSFWPWRNFDYEKAFNTLVEKDKTGELMYLAGKNRWLEFIDHKRAFNLLLEKDKTGEWICKSGKTWNENKFDFKTALGVLKNKSSKYYKEALESWPKKASEILSKINKETSKINKSKDKKIVLENVDNSEARKFYNKIQLSYDDVNYEEALEELLRLDKDGTYLVLAGRDWDWTGFDHARVQKAIEKVDSTGIMTIRAGGNWGKGHFDFDRGLDFLIKIDETGKWIYEAGLAWEDFNSDKGLDALNIVDETGKWIYEAGLAWEDFNFKKGFDLLCSSEKRTYYLVSAGEEWEHFNYAKGFKHLEQLAKKTGYYYVNLIRAKRTWPPTASEAIRKYRSEAKKAGLVPDKKFVLENVIESEKEGKDIYLKGKKLGDFDNSDDLLDELIKKDETGYWIYHAGLEWPRANFNYKKAQEAVANVDDYGSSLSDCGNSWPRFDYKKGFEDLIRKDKSGKFISNAGKKWKDFDYEKALDLLIERDKTGQWIYEAGIFWPKKEFNFDKALRSLVEKRKDKTVRNNAKDYVPYAKTYWPVFNSDIVLDGYDEDFEVFKKDLFNAGKYWKDFNHKKGLDILIKHRANGVIYLAGLEWKEFNHKKALEYLKKNNRKNYKKAMDNWPKTASEELGRIEKETKKIDKIEDRKLKLESVFMELSNGR